MAYERLGFGVLAPTVTSVRATSAPTGSPTYMTMSSVYEPAPSSVNVRAPSVPDVYSSAEVRAPAAQDMLDLTGPLALYQKVTFQPLVSGGATGPRMAVSLDRTASGWSSGARSAGSGGGEQPPADGTKDFPPLPSEPGQPECKTWDCLSAEAKKTYCAMYPAFAMCPGAKKKVATGGGSGTMIAAVAGLAALLLLKR